MVPIGESKTTNKIVIFKIILFYWLRLSFSLLLELSSNRKVPDLIIIHLPVGTFEAKFDRTSITRASIAIPLEQSTRE